MIRMLSYPMLFISIAACTSEQTELTKACVERVKARLAAPSTIKVLSSELMKRTSFSPQEYALSMAQMVAEFRATSAKANTEAEKIGADAAASYASKIDVAQEYVRDLEKGSEISRVDIRFDSKNKLGVTLPGRASCFNVDNPSGSDKSFLVMGND